jgi:hypothetical protein
VSWVLEPVEGAENTYRIKHPGGGLMWIVDKPGTQCKITVGMVLNAPDNETAFSFKKGNLG